MQTDLQSAPPLAEPRPRYDIVAVCCLLASIVLTLDLLAPMGIASGALYVTVVMYSLLADNAKVAWLTAWSVTGFILIGMGASHFSQHPGLHEPPWILLANRAVALTVIWLTAFLGVRLLKVKRQVLEHGLELQRMNVELNRIARHDALTGIANRRYFDERLNLEFLRATRDKSPLSLLMIDVDYFKKYNDRHGHQAGDACLIRVAQAVQSSLRRPADLLARYGGEEFGVILPDTSAGGAGDRAEAIRKGIEALMIEHPGSHENTSVTVSIGVASIIPGEDGETPAKLITAADGALYEVKQSGRNAVRVAT